MSTKPASRERLVLDYLAGHSEGVSFGDLRLAVAPDVEATKFGGTISTLMRRKWIVRTGKVRHYLYRLSAVQPVDKRKTRTKATPVALAKPRAARKPLATLPVSIPAGAAAQSTKLQQAPVRSHVVDAKQAERDAIARDIAAFQKKGGTIQKLSHGEHSKSGKSLAQQQSDFLATRSRVSEIPLHRRAKSAA